MENIDIFVPHTWSLGALFGIDHPLLLVQADIIQTTWCVCAFLLVLFIAMRLIITRTHGVGAYIVIQSLMGFITLCDQTIGFFSRKHVSFIYALFVFILACNICALIPGIEEPTRDLNTTLALGLIVFVYIQYEAIKKHGLYAYIKSYFQPIFILLPINIIGKLASVVSMSFRLFGNIFGGSLITHIYATVISKHWIIQILTFVTGINMLVALFFTLFEGVLQAFVFTMLTITYLGLTLQEEGGGH